MRTKLHEIEQALEALGVWEAIKQASQERAKVVQSIVATVTTFLGLSDTPETYVGNAGKYLAVNSGETSLEFVTGSDVTDEDYKRYTLLMQ